MFFRGGVAAEGISTSLQKEPGIGLSSPMGHPPQYNWTDMIICRALFLLITILLACSSCGYGNAGSTTSQDPRLQSTMTLYRLDGDRYPGDPVSDSAVLLHDWPILQVCPIQLPATQQKVLNALDEGIANGGGVPIDCYNPRHAVRLESNTVTTDFMICFQCQNYEIWERDERVGGGLISKAPQSTFNEVLENCILND